jgi:hypothetical protein
LAHHLPFFEKKGKRKKLYLVLFSFLTRGKQGREKQAKETSLTHSFSLKRRERVSLRQELKTVLTED